MLTPEDKDQIPTFDKSMVIYQLKCFCENSYTGLIIRQLKKMVKEHIPACINIFLNLANKKEKSSSKIISAIKGSAFAEHLVNNQGCAKNFNLEKCKII